MDDLQQLVTRLHADPVVVQRATLLADRMLPSSATAQDIQWLVEDLILVAARFSAYLRARG